MFGQYLAGQRRYSPNSLDTTVVVSIAASVIQTMEAPKRIVPDAVLSAVYSLTPVVIAAMFIAGIEFRPIAILKPLIYSAAFGFPIACLVDFILSEVIRGGEISSPAYLNRARRISRVSWWMLMWVTTLGAIPFSGPN